MIAVDVMPRMIEEAERRCGGRGRFFVADLADPLPIAPNSLDGITCSLALHYVQNWSVPLRSFASALQAGGWAILTSGGDPCPSPSRHSPMPASSFIVYFLFKTA
ncbi:hypothetical protein BH24ACT12_BH24ACT12_05190 [soil metagenome]